MNYLKRCEHCDRLLRDDEPHECEPEEVMYTRWERRRYPFPWQQEMEE